MEKSNFTYKIVLSIVTLSNINGRNHSMLRNVSFVSRSDKKVYAALGEILFLKFKSIIEKQSPHIGKNVSKFSLLGVHECIQSHALILLAGDWKYLK